MAETLASLNAELNAMPARERRAILRSLSKAERDALERLTAQGGIGLAVSPEGQGKALFSAPFAQRISEVRQDIGPGKAGMMTAASRNALLAAAEALDPKEGAATTRGQSRDAGRSLLDAFGGMLSSRQHRP